MSNDLVDRTSDPATLTSDDIASATTDLQDIQTSALTNDNVLTYTLCSQFLAHANIIISPQVRQNYLQTIDNLMQADGDSIVQSQVENNSSSK